MSRPTDPTERGRAYLVGVIHAAGGSREVEQHLDELERLADTASFATVGRALLPRREIHPATFIGRGQAEDVAAMARGLGADLVIVDEDLSPAQSRNLERIFDLPVVDRSGLIIDIFAEHARSREARTQVEIAQLEYLLPRLAGRWTHLSRQVGGGPGGTKGEGEKQIELDRRMIRRRIDRLRRELRRLLRGRQVRRESRTGLPQAALVGYTNVGKSSLFNAVVAAGVKVEDRLFATLDPTVRRVDLGRRGALLLKDTVGLIRKLPHHLVASFRSTFEEAAEADLLVHVADAAHPRLDEQLATVDRVLDDGLLGEMPRLMVFNKVDAADPAALAELRRRWPAAAFVSARTGRGVEALVERLADRLLGLEVSATLAVPHARQDIVAELSRRGVVLGWEAVDGRLDVRVQGPAALIARLERELAAGSEEVAG